MAIEKASKVVNIQYMKKIVVTDLDSIMPLVEKALPIGIKSCLKNLMGSCLN